MNLDALLSALDNLPAAPAPGPAGSFAGPGLTSMEAELLDTIGQIFTERLPAVFPGWERRPQQIEMAKTVRLALARRKAALIEAGTGTGKSLALLAAAVEHSREMWMPVIVSTGTHVLQEQYLTKDVPVLQKAIGHFNVALAKGKANYLCLKRLDEETRQLAFDADDPMNQIADWAEETETGDRAELPAGLAEHWHRVNVDDSCTRDKCPFYDECFYYRARREMERADIVIANHALLVADLAVRMASDGHASLLPKPAGVIIDEAHHLETAARQGLGIELTQTRLPRILADVRRRMPTVEPDVIQGCVAAHEQLFAFLSDALKEDRGEINVGDVHESLQDALVELRKALQREAARATVQEIADEIEVLSERVKSYLHDLWLLAEPGPSYVVWAERQRSDNGTTALTIHATPVDVASTLARHLFERCSVVCSSATLTTNRTFDYLRRSVGAPDDALEFVADSPFDYKRQALLYIPADLPDPKAPDFHAQIAGEVEAVLRASRGRAFVLSTSYQGMRELYDRIVPRGSLTCFHQGQMSRQELLERFKRDVHSVLFATASFWEGVDVQGEALSCVIIDRLPFAVPTDPVTQAKVRAIEAAGGNAFADYSLPEAVLRLRQGFGRLIRSQSDRGVVAIMDRRILQARYGRVFLNSLPAARLTRRIEDVEQFFAEEVGAA